jgi:hypothetical protein
MSCVSTKPYEDIEYDLYKPLINKLLSVYHGKILTPQDVVNIDLKTLPQNYKFTLTLYEDGKKAVDNDKSTHKFIGMENNAFLFAATNTSDKYKTEIQKYRIIDNRVFYQVGSKLKPLELSRCYFVVGKCSFLDSLSNNLSKASTVYDNGLWITTYKSPLGSQVKRVAIYDKFGLPIYQSNFIKSSGGMTSIVFSRE